MQSEIMTVIYKCFLIKQNIELSIGIAQVNTHKRCITFEVRGWEIDKLFP